MNSFEFKVTHPIESLDRNMFYKYKADNYIGGCWLKNGVKRVV